jgi:hypothetical protein
MKEFANSSSCRLIASCEGALARTLSNGAVHLLAKRQRSESSATARWVIPDITTARQDWVPDNTESCLEGAIAMLAVETEMQNLR